jgi:hypothetical protein
MRNLLLDNSQKNTGIGYLMFDEKQVAKRFDFFADREFRRLIKRKVYDEDKTLLNMNEWRFQAADAQTDIIWKGLHRGWIIGWTKTFIVLVLTFGIALAVMEPVWLKKGFT